MKPRVILHLQYTTSRSIDRSGGWFVTAETVRQQGATTLLANHGELGLKQIVNEGCMGGNGEMGEKGLPALAGAVASMKI